MASDPFIDILTKQSGARLRELDADLTGTIERSTFERDIVRQALAVKEGTTRADIESASDIAESRAVAEVKTSGRAPRSNKREPIKRLMETDAARTWMPAEVADRLAEQGVKSSRDAIRVTMRRMLGDHELERPPSGNGFLLPRNGRGSDNLPQTAGPDGEGRETGLWDGAPGRGSG